jgi:major structural subunit of bundle-forming pilus
MFHTTAAIAAPSRRNSGFGLVEIAMVLAIVAILVAGIMLFFNNASSAMKANQSGEELATVSQVVRSLWAGQSDYSSLSTAAVAGSGQMPKQWVKSSTALTNPFGGAVAVSGTNVNANFYVFMSSVPNLACERNATTDMGTGLVAAFLDTQPVTFPMTPANAATPCMVSSGTYANNHVIAWALN